MTASRVEPPLIQLPLFDFEGPLELLLTLVERRRLPIAEVSLAMVADQYLGHVHSKGVSQEALADFLVIGARLVLIKSRALLPRDEEQDAGEEESAEDLVRRLEVYRTFRVLASQLEQLDAGGLSAYPRGALRAAMAADEPAPLEAIDAGLLASLLREIEARTAPEPVQEPAVVPQVTIAERVEALRDRLRRDHVVRWDDVAGRTVREIVATFLAVLEMARRGELRAEQDELFGPIRLIRREVPTEGAGEAAAFRQAQVAQEDEVVLAPYAEQDLGVGG